MSDERFIFLGIDPGSANPGVAAFGSVIPTIFRHLSYPREFSGVVGDVDRIGTLGFGVCSVFNSLGIDRVGLANKDYSLFVTASIEGPAFNRFSRGTIETGMVHLKVYETIKSFFTSLTGNVFVNVITVPPKVLKKYVSGSGSSDKRTMMRTIRDRWNLYDHRDLSQDVCEAYALSRLGYDLVSGFIDHADVCSYASIDNGVYVEVVYNDILRSDCVLGFDFDVTS